MKKLTMRTYVSSLALASSLLSGAAFAQTPADELIQNAKYSELGDMLTTTQAQGRYAWLKKCYDGLLVEMWEQMFDTRDIIPKEQKLQQLKELWLSQAKVAAGQAQYVTFANEDFTNPYEWTAGTSENQACTLMPPEYQPVALKTAVLKHQYCENTSFGSEWEWIEGVTVEEFEHASGSHKHTMVSGKVVTFPANRAVKVSVTPGSIIPEYPSYVALRVWVDWNHNGVFDANEMMHSSASDGVFQFVFNVPKDVPDGVTMMRVALDAGGGSDNACRRIQYGEVEDYLITVR
ncbi:GEVED domain-containing protein [Pseudoalteromonas luteoviolacea]|uniref:GEVED domain-containing protein n=1 Tax=Pseudoalteromonas luteoviolacea TaxID=43657 RepID=UPI001F3E3AC1|nr:GEVED domain-containing protein [Pseudoalteromonas luteoviolacea]MCF6441566.1 GEVED domain-containing protein [Pseudoalteromonas luteoviolacea]